MAASDEAIDTIKEMLSDGRLKPGDRLPPEAELGALLGVSRNALREAVKALTLIHVLDVRQGDGTFVTSLAPGLMLGVLAFAVDVQPDRSLLHFFEVRRILEPEATAKATLSMSDDEVQALGALVDEPGDDPDVDTLMANDQEFHRRIAEAAGNPVLAAILQSLSGRTRRARMWRGLSDQAAIRRTLDEHRAICAAIAARKPDVAAAWARVHVAGVEDWLASVLPADEAAGPA